MRVGKYVSEYIKPEQLKQTGPRCVRIVDAVEISFEGRDGRPAETKPALVVDDAGDTRKVVLNKENLKVLIELFSTDDSATWVGHEVELYHDPNVSFGGKRTGGLRLRPAPADLPF